MQKANTRLQASRDDDTDLRALVERACARIAPSWPLDRFIAVNPLWGNVDRPLELAAARLASLSASRMLMPRAWYRDQWQAGKIRLDHLCQATHERFDHPAEHFLRLLETDESRPPRRARVTDVADARGDLAHAVSWCEFVTQNVSRFCAAYFDQGQAQLGPTRAAGLYGGWRQHARADRSPALLMGTRVYRELVDELPSDVYELIGTGLEQLDVPVADQEPYLTSLLLDINGWAAWCAYLRWNARLDGLDDSHIIELLAIRLGWERILFRAGGRSLGTQWQMAMGRWPLVDRAAAATQADDWVFQRALEIAYQEELARALRKGFAAKPPARPLAQVVFCIDVRSEPLRRALEQESQHVQTLGFAGFFGLPAAYQPLGSANARPQLPGLLAPRMLILDDAPTALAVQRSERLELSATLGHFKRSAVSGFSFVEAVGPFYAIKLLSDALGQTRPGVQKEHAGLSRRERAERRPRLAKLLDGSPLDLAARCNLAANILRAMSLTHDFAPVVALIGHGSASANNAHAAGLDCGACCGQTGEVNARALASLLNEADVRAGLKARGIAVPETTWFIAGLHNTTTDEVELFDLEGRGDEQRGQADRLQTWLAAAGRRARVRRARSLALPSDLAEAQLRSAMRARARDWAETRPEWGLAGNAAFIVAPREYTRHADLSGRAFLHDYRWQEDTGFATLELIMTAPMIVTHWINFQYYASTVDNARYGSGNKVLHNVVGGNLGVVEGNGGDLRIGLPMQSLHDGTRWVHVPQRLSVYIEAPRPAIESILRKHTKVQQLVENEWLYLFALDAAARTVHGYRAGAWTLAAP